MPIAFGSLGLTPDEFYRMTPAEFDAACIGLRNEKKEWLMVEARKMNYTLVGKVKHPPKPAKIYRELTGEPIDDGKDGTGEELLQSMAATARGGSNPKDNAARLARHIRSRNGN